MASARVSGKQLAHKLAASYSALPCLFNHRRAELFRSFRCSSSTPLSQHFATSSGRHLGVPVDRTWLTDANRICCRSLAHSVAESGSPDWREKSVADQRTDTASQPSVDAVNSALQTSNAKSSTKKPKAARRTRPPLFQLTDRAAERINQLIGKKLSERQQSSQQAAWSSEPKAEPEGQRENSMLALKIGLKRQGCNGLTYTMNYTYVPVHAIERPLDSSLLSGDDENEKKKAGTVTRLDGEVRRADSELTASEQETARERGGGGRGLNATDEEARQLGGDILIQDKGVLVLLDKAAVMYLVGSEMDFVTDELSAQFVFNNPNQRSQCGCGKSFTV